MNQSGKRKPENRPQKKNNPPSARETALELTFAILEKDAFSNLALEKQLADSPLKPEDRRLATELVNGTVRMRLRLDWTLQLFLKKPLAKMNPWLKNILRLSAYQILFMERIPDHAVVSEAVELTRSRAGEGLTGLCNGVLRSLLREKDRLEEKLDEIPDPVQRASRRYSLPEFMVRELEEILPEAEREAVYSYYNRPGRVELRTNRLKTTPEALAETLRQEQAEVRLLEDVPGALEVTEQAQPLTALPSFRAGYYYLQNRASQLAALIAAPQPGELILDLCSGIGGKSTHLAEKSGDGAKIIAAERYAHKLQLLLENCERLGLKSVQPLCADLTRGLPDYAAKADCVILDAPCSGWGVLNRRADLRWHQDPAQLKELETLQAELLEQAVRCVKPGGLLLYITCTLRPRENREQVAAFLKRHPECRAESMAEELAFFPLSEEDREEARRGMLTILPGKYGTDGMFYAKVRKEE